jgi:hypothetical protein
MRADVPPLAIERGEAIAIAEAASPSAACVLGRLGPHGGAAPCRRRRRASVSGMRSCGARRAAGYRALVGNALAPPLWDVRFARFRRRRRGARGRVARHRDRRRQGARRGAIGCPRRARARRLRAPTRRRWPDRTVAEQFGADVARWCRAAPRGIRAARAQGWLFAYADPRVRRRQDGGGAHDRSPSRATRSPAASRSDVRARELAARGVGARRPPARWCDRSRSAPSRSRRSRRLVFAMVAWARGRSEPVAALAADERVRFLDD